MGSEAGESLDQIIKRKEVERRANGGVFTWGVGSSLGDSADLLRQMTNMATVVFTPMLSKPKFIDERPSKVLLWLGGRARTGEMVDLPPYSLLTSRGHTQNKGNKKKHYALLCRSIDPIEQVYGQHLDGSSVVNLKTGNPVGSSQVTAVVRQVGNCSGQKRLYSVGFTAGLLKHAQIILDQFAVISERDTHGIIGAAKAGDVEGWKFEVEVLKNRAIESVEIMHHCTSS